MDILMTYDRSGGLMLFRRLSAQAWPAVGDLVDVVPDRLTLVVEGRVWNASFTSLEIWLADRPNMDLSDDVVTGILLDAGWSDDLLEG